MALRGEALWLPDRYGDLWTAETPVDLAALDAGTWDLRLTLRFRDGTSREATAHALAGPGLLRRRAIPELHYGVVLVRPYRTHAGALALRTAPGWRGMTTVVRRRLGRLVH
ncbi:MULTISPECIES: hypothetical protein [Streptomyces]|uniref:hypothetical protein n=1 Tax=Streptomyces TaxID=1883 RepID=UPI000C3A2E14|nr:hypothetical protein B1C81_26345 [Streptomyces sp. HG99]